MAKLKAHGREIGTVYLLTVAKRYMSDGVILKGIAGDWKLWGKVKPDIAPETAFQNARARVDTYHNENPAYAAYREALHNLACQSKRSKLHTCVSLMPDDADGVWSEACDGYGENIAADIDEVSELCRLYLAYESERKSKNPNVRRDDTAPAAPPA